MEVLKTFAMYLIFEVNELILLLFLDNFFTLNSLIPKYNFKALIKFRRVKITVLFVKEGCCECHLKYIGQN